MSNPPTPIRYIVTLDPERTEPAFAELAALDRAGLVRMQAVPAAPATPAPTSTPRAPSLREVAAEFVRLRLAMLEARAIRQPQDDADRLAYLKAWQALVMAATTKEGA